MAEPFSQVSSFDHLHREEGISHRMSRQRVDRRNVGVLQLSRHPRFLDDLAMLYAVASVLCTQTLHRNFTPEGLVNRNAHSRHSTSTKASDSHRRLARGEVVARKQTQVGT